jgi:hypothetical protein
MLDIDSLKAKVEMLDSDIGYQLSVIRFQHPHHITNNHL